MSWQGYRAPETCRPLPGSPDLQALRKPRACPDRAPPDRSRPNTPWPFVCSLFGSPSLSRFADKSSLQLAQPGERRVRQRPFVDGRERRLELLDIGKPDLGGGELARRDGKTHRELGQARGMALAHHQPEPPPPRALPPPRPAACPRSAGG